MSQFLAALVGAFVGGLATFAAAYYQTRQLLRHERQLAHQAALEDRRAARAELDRVSATKVLEVLPQLEQAMAHIANGGYVWASTASTATTATIEDLRDLQPSTLPLLPAALQERFATLRSLISKFGKAYGAGSDGTVLQPNWSPEKVTRAYEDLRSYLAYLRRGMIAVIDGEPLPQDAPPPVLRREDLSVWQAPDKSYFVGGDGSDC